MNSLLKTLAMTFFGALVLGYCSLLWAAEWTLYYQTDTEKENRIITGKYYFDKSTVEKPEKDIVRLTEKITQSLAGREEADKKITQMEINCSSRKYRILSRTEYDDVTGKALAEDRNKIQPWSRFSLDSIMGDLRDNLCFEKKQAKQPDKKPDKQQDKQSAK